MSNSSSIGTDGLSPLIIKSNSSLIGHQLAFIFNLSFTQGVFPKLLKSSIVIPIFKGGSHSEPGNYRPISILTIFSKLLEKLYYNRLTSFINYHGILHNNQFGFRKHKSTSLAVANVLSSLITKIKTNKKVAFVLLDLKKAFDFINHDLLLMKVKHYGIRGLPLLWLYSYLSNRTQKVKVNDSISNVLPVSAGVPQGSILGPMLFILFINDVFQFNATNCELYLYADDTAIIFAADNVIELQSCVDCFFAQYSSWCMHNCIVVNPAKSNFLLYNTDNVVISIDGQMINNTNCAKYLGLYIDNRLSWNYHVSHVTKQCCVKIGVLKKVLPCLPSCVVPLYYNSFIRSCFSYCLMFWYNNDRSGRHKLVNKIDNLISKLISRCLVNHLHMNNVFAVFKLQCLSFMYDICNHIIHVPFLSIVSNNMIHNHFTRSYANIHVDTVTSLEKRNFIYNCILAWNECPREIRSVSKHAFIQYCKLNLI
jgi:hypothetical protein